MARKRRGLVSPYLNIGLSDYPSLQIIHKFGHNNDTGTSFEPIADNGIYRTPQFDDATTLRIKAGGNANDTADGTGARQIILQGLDETGAIVQDTLTTAGTSASASTTKTFLRLFRAWVSESGTYATTDQGSHAGSIIIEDSAGTEDWAYLQINDFPEGQTAISAYSVPLGKTAYILSIEIAVDSNKTATILGFKRENILKTQPPYDAKRMFMEFGGITGQSTIKPLTPFGPYPALTDIVFMGKMSQQSGEIDINFEILLVDGE